MVGGDGAGVWARGHVPDAWSHGVGVNHSGASVATGAPHSHSNGVAIGAGARAPGRDRNGVVADADALGGVNHVVDDAAHLGSTVARDAKGRSQ